MIAYFDCYSGASGDMLLGALIDAGCPVEVLRQGLSSLRLKRMELQVLRSEKMGLSGLQVKASGAAKQPLDTLAALLEVVNTSPLPSRVQEISRAAFTRLAEAEARVHGTFLEAVRLHDAGGVDTVVDVVGSAIALEHLGVSQCYCSPLPAGHGTVATEHGPYPNPAPATLEILARAGAPLVALDVEAELVTPTAAAILATVAQFGRPQMILKATGYGLGSRDLPWPNALRVWLGEELGEGLQTDQVVLLETNIDDMTGELLGHAMERLLEAGALDVYFTPIQMKKNRPAVKLSILSPIPLAHSLAQQILRETSSLGLRYQPILRLKAPRRIVVVTTPVGPVRVKVKELEGEESTAPEYEDCARLAGEAGLPIAQVYAMALRAFGQAKE